MPLTVSQFLLVGLAAIAGGFVNAVAGGGTLITFPALTAVGLPPVMANMTNTVALCPGYLGGTFAQRADLAGQRRRLWLLLPAGVLGGLAGGALLRFTSDAAFRRLVPWLILLATALLAFQDPLKRWAFRFSSHHAHVREAWAALPMFLAAIYGGYFGAGLGVMTLALLGLLLEDSLTRLNALKQGLSFAINITAAGYFLFSGRLHWPAMAVMAVGALAGGALGGRLAGRIQPAALRWLVVAVGAVVAGIYFLR